MAVTMTGSTALQRFNEERKMLLVQRLWAATVNVLAAHETALCSCRMKLQHASPIQPRLFVFHLKCMSHSPTPCALSGVGKAVRPIMPTLSRIHENLRRQICFHRRKTPEITPTCPKKEATIGAMA